MIWYCEHQALAKLIPRQPRIAKIKQGKIEQTHPHNTQGKRKRLAKTAAKYDRAGRQFYWAKPVLSAPPREKEIDSSVCKFKSPGRRISQKLSRPLEFSFWKCMHLVFWGQGRLVARSDSSKDFAWRIVILEEVEGRVEGKRGKGGVTSQGCFYGSYACHARLA